VSPIGDPAAAFRAAYAAALEDYRRDPGEQSLWVAYELGREAVGRQLSVLDLAVTHQEALTAALAAAPGITEAQDVVRAAGDFFLESLSSFEMVRRGFSEALNAATLERRQTAMSRQLSTFLADASLALDASDSLEEMLRLVAEQARELIGAACCVATVAVAGQPRTAEAASYPEADRRWRAFVQWLDLAAIHRLVELSGGLVRSEGEELARSAAFHLQDADRPLQSWLAASLTALDGSGLGVIQLFDKDEGNFTEEDGAALLHLAQMASAAVERTRLYREPG
jgi:hypothetical protein